MDPDKLPLTNAECSHRHRAALARAPVCASFWLRTALLACCLAMQFACTPAPDQESAALAESGKLLNEPASDGPLLRARKAEIARALAGDGVIRAAEATLDSEQRQAQELALSHPQFIAEGKSDAQLLLSQVFSIYPVRPSEHPEILKACEGQRCYRVERYNFARNRAVIGYARLGANPILLAARVLEETQPDVPPALGELATEIARLSPEVHAALGYTPDAADALMASTKTALNRTRCERSQHLCVAPTFVVGERALWTIVDLTELKLVGIRWTQVGHSISAGWTEKTLQNEFITRNYCERSHAVERDGWRFSYMLTASDGLRIVDVSFQGQARFRDVKLVDWHVNYSGSDGFGYSDAVGCPYFSQAAVLAVEPPVLRDMGEQGFELVQGYWSDGWPMPCNYNYEQRYQFYRDGSFRPLVASLGRGCGDDGTYRPVTRIALAEPTPVARFVDAQWRALDVESWLLQGDDTVSPEGALLRIGNSASGQWMLAARGQFGDGGLGDQAYVYVTAEHPERDEGSSDLMTIGPCCNTDYRQGPERFLEPPEALTGSTPVVWYVAQLKNNDQPGSEYCWAETVVENGDFVEKVHPCPSGPLFVPYQEAGHGAR